MKQRITMMCAGVALLLMGTVAAAGGDQDAVAKVCRLVPADLPLVAVVRDIEKLDRTIADFRRRVDPDGSGDGILDGIKGDLPIADWVDFSAPMVVAQTEVGGMSESWAMWVRVPDFQEKIKGFDGATLKEGV